MSVGHAKNVCRSQNSMKPFFLYYQWITNVFLLVSPAVMVIMNNPSNFQALLRLLAPSKWVSKVTLNVCQLKDRSAYH